MPVFYYQDAYLVRRVVGVQATTQEEAFIRVSDGSHFVYEERLDPETIEGWEETTLEAFHENVGAGDVWTLGKAWRDKDE